MPKFQSSIGRPESIGHMLYGRKWIPEVFQMRFAPRIDIISLLVQILSNFEKSHFLEFSFVGFQHFDARRIFYGCRNGRLLSGTPPNTLGLFPEKNANNNSPQFRSQHTFCDFSTKVKNDAFQNILKNPCHSWFFVANMLLF